MTEAIFGLVGVLVGGAITWGIEAARERRRRREELRVAVRLVSAELKELDYRARFPQRAKGPAAPAWQAHQHVLARDLNDETWSTVAHAYEDLLYVEQGRPVAEGADRTYTAAGALRQLLKPPETRGRMRFVFPMRRKSR
jgi:hypothetical protein